MVELYNIVNITNNSVVSSSKEFSFDFTSLGCNVSQLDLINESNKLIPKISFIIIALAFLFLLTEFVLLPFFKDRSWYFYFVGLFGWFGTCLVFFGMWLLMPFAFTFSSVGEMAIPGIVLVIIILVAMFFKRRNEKNDVKKD